MTSNHDAKWQKGKFEQRKAVSEGAKQAMAEYYDAGLNTGRQRDELLRDLGKWCGRSVRQVERYIAERRQERNTDDVAPDPITPGLDLVERLADALAGISIKDNAVWRLPDATWIWNVPDDSLFNIRVDYQGKVTQVLGVEKDKRYGLLLKLLEQRFPEFRAFDEFRQRLADLVIRCQGVCRRIWTDAVNRTGLQVPAVSNPMSLDPGHLQQMPRFVYEFAVDHRGQHVAPGDFQIVEVDRSKSPWSPPSHRQLTPQGAPGYVLAVGPQGLMQTCRTVIVEMCRHYAGDPEIEALGRQEEEVKRQADVYVKTLSGLLQQA